MRKVWVLDTETKGTGAEMLPLEKVLEQPVATRGPVLAPENPPAWKGPPAPRPPARFKVVDVMTREVLAEDADARTTLDVLEGFRSLVDVSVYRWDLDAGSWRPLTLAERRTLWAYRDRRADERRRAASGGDARRRPPPSGAQAA